MKPSLSAGLSGMGEPESSRLEEKDLEKMGGEWGDGGMHDAKHKMRGRLYEGHITHRWVMVWKR